MEFTSNTQGIDVKYIASLARISLRPEEIEPLQRQMDDILAYFEELKKLEVGDVGEGDVSEGTAAWREDREKGELGQAAALELAVQSRHDQFVVPKIIE